MEGGSRGGRAAGLLTEKQLLVLALSARGVSVSRIAGLLGVSRQDVSVALRRARRNVEAARETLEAFHAAAAPVARLPPGSTLPETASIVLGAADSAGVKLGLGRSELLSVLRSLLDGLVSEDGRLTEEVCIAVSPLDKLPHMVSCRLVDMVEELIRPLLGGTG
jgi:Tfx family DNA-binding protein